MVTKLWKVGIMTSPLPIYGDGWCGDDHHIINIYNIYIIHKESACSEGRMFVALVLVRDRI